MTRVLQIRRLFAAVAALAGTNARPSVALCGNVNHASPFRCC